MASLNMRFTKTRMASMMFKHADANLFIRLYIAIWWLIYGHVVTIRPTIGDRHVLP